MCLWKCRLTAAFGFYQSNYPHLFPFPFLHGEPSSTLFHYPTLPHHSGISYRAILSPETSSLRFSFLFLFFHIMITLNRRSPWLYFFFYLSIQSLPLFRLHSSFSLVFNLTSSPSLFSPAAPCNANTTCSEGK